MTKPEGPKGPSRTLVGQPIPGREIEDEAPVPPSAQHPVSPAALAAQPGVLATSVQSQLESTVPFGSSALRAALDAALAAGPQAVAAEVARLRQDAAGGSSAAIKIL